MVEAKLHVTEVQKYYSKCKVVAGRPCSKMYVVRAAP
jgi:hypothetical protein